MPAPDSPPPPRSRIPTTVYHAARLVCSPAPSCIGSRGSVELAGLRRPQDLGIWVGCCTPARGSRPPARAGGDARHGVPSSATRTSASPSIFLVREQKQGDGGRRSAWAPSWTSPPTCSPRTRLLPPWRPRAGTRMRSVFVGNLH